MQETRKHAEDNVDAGRRYIAAYVEFMHYVERMHQAMAQLSSHAEHTVQATEAGLHHDR